MCLASTQRSTELSNSWRCFANEQFPERLGQEPCSQMCPQKRSLCVRRVCFRLTVVQCQRWQERDVASTRHGSVSYGTTMARECGWVSATNHCISCSVPFSFSLSLYPSFSLKEAPWVCDQRWVLAVTADAEAGRLSFSSKGVRFRSRLRGELWCRPRMLGLQKVLFQRLWLHLPSTKQPL